MKRWAAIAFALLAVALTIAPPPLLFLAWVLSPRWALGWWGTLADGTAEVSNLSLYAHLLLTPFIAVPAIALGKEPSWTRIAGIVTFALWFAALILVFALAL